MNSSGQTHSTSAAEGKDADGSKVRRRKQRSKLAHQPGVLTAAPPASDSSSLRDPRIPTAQRQSMAAQLGRFHGNRHLAAQIAEEHAEQREAASRAGAGMQESAAKEKPSAADSAGVLHQALIGYWERRERAYDAKGEMQAVIVPELEKHGPAERPQVEAEYQRQFHEALRATLRRVGVWMLPEHRLRIYALLNGAGSVHDDQVQMAMALHLERTQSTDEAFRILYKLSLQGRKELARKYRETFATLDFYADVGADAGLTNRSSGSLEGDIKMRYSFWSHNSAWERQKLLALLDRDLTQADELYFETVGIHGTKSKAAVGRIRKLWQQGPEQLTQLFADWDRYVCNRSGWSDETWTRKGLYQALDGDSLTGELSGEDWAVVKAILDAHRAFESDAITFADTWDREARPGAGTQRQWRLESARLRAAEAIWKQSAGAAAESAQTMREIWQAQIARYQGDPAMQERLAREWEARKRELLGSLARDATAESEFAQLRLVLEGSLQPVDEFYLAAKAGREDRVIDIATGIWIADRVDEFFEQASYPRLAQSSGSGAEDAPGKQIVRPKFNFDIIVGAGALSRGTVERLVAMLTPARSRVWRGARRLKREIDEGDGNSALQAVLKFLQTPGMDAELRSEIVESYTNEFLPGRQPGPTVLPPPPPRERFLAFLHQRHHTFAVGSVAFVDLTNLLLGPAVSLDDIFLRAQARERATHTGLLDPLAQGLVKTFASDKQHWMEESLAKLRWMAEKARTNPNELEVMAAQAGAGSVLELGNVEYGVFKARLDELREAKGAIADAFAFLMESWGRSVLVGLLGATGVGGLAAALIAFMAGMAAREGLQGEDYDLVTLANIATLASEFATYGVDELIKLEAIIVGAFPAESFTALLKIKTPGKADAIAKFVQDTTKTIMTRLIEKGTASAIEGKGLEGIDKLVASSIAICLLKAKSASAIVPNTFYTTWGNRLGTNVKKVMVGGPPPKAALANAILKAVWDLVYDPKLADLTGPERARLIAKGLGQALFMDIGVGMAFTHLQHKEATRGRKLYLDGDLQLYETAQYNPKVAAGYQAYKDKQAADGAAADNLDVWLATNPKFLSDFLKDAVEMIPEQKPRKGAQAEGASPVAAAVAGAAPGAPKPAPAATSPAAAP